MSDLKNKIINKEEFYLIVTTPGVDTSKQMNFSWHTAQTGSQFYYYQEQEGIDSSKKVNPQERIWSIKDQPKVPEDSEFYKDRIIANVSLDDLIPNTKYCYFIANENYQSETYTFTTSGSNEEFEWMAIVDTQHPFNDNTKKLIDSIKSQSNNITLITCSGDLTGCSAYQKEYEWLLEDNFKDSIFACAPGDHEYWANKTGSPYPMFSTPYTFNAVLNNPKNGCIESINSNYYFYYNNILFLIVDMLDSNMATGQKLDAQVEWFKETMNQLEGTYQYSVLLAHKSIYGSSEIDRVVRKYITPVWSKLMDQYKIDLAIGGHDHMYSRTYPIYNDTRVGSSLEGTYYLDLGSSGNKYRTSSSDLYNDGLHEKIYDLKSLDYAVGARIIVNNKNMKIKVMNSNGEEIDSFEIQAKRNNKK